jgi:two-component system chemotaxis response regulator CheB
LKKVLIVDDSALVRKQLSEIISENKEFVIDTAKNGKDAIDKVIQNNYSVITMDVNMPILGGVEATEQIMKINPTPILMISSLTTETADITFQALSFGAVDYIEKPGTFSIGSKTKEEILEKVTALSKITKSWLKRREISKQRNILQNVGKSQNRQSTNVKSKSSLDIQKLILIGSSTGGPNLIEQIVSSIPEDFPHPICIVQHMPNTLTKSFANRLNSKSPLDVIEVIESIELLPNNIYIASGGTDLIFKKKVSGKIFVNADITKTDNFFKPSIDELFLSSIGVFEPKNIFGIILTGIGNDGTEGAKKLKEKGAYLVGESEDSAVIYGMPKSAFEAGALSEQLPFDKILNKIITFN